MARAPARRPASPPACYALVLPGLEPVAAAEVADDLGAEVKKSGRGIVVFRPPALDDSLLQLRTTEDVFLLAWGTDSLTYRACDLDSIRKWTARDADWTNLLRLHHALRPKPKGKPTYHLVAQMTGRHGYRRLDALEALARGLAGKFPASWRPADENAAVEVWLTIHGQTAVCGLRLSDRSMRHRAWKLEHRPASLRPTAAAAMIRLADPEGGQTLLDPLCGAGTLLAEAIAYARQQRLGRIDVVGGDLDPAAVRAAETNLRRVGPTTLRVWDARRLPLPDASIDRLVTNPPFGKQLASPDEVGPLYRALVPEFDRVLRPGGRTVLVVSEFPPFREAAFAAGWRLTRQLEVRLLGQPAIISAWQKPAG